MTLYQVRMNGGGWNNVLIHKEHSYTYEKRPALQVKTAQKIIEEMQTGTRHTEKADYIGSHGSASDVLANLLSTLHRLGVI